MERLVLPALLALLFVGAFVILATNGGGEDAASSPPPSTRSTPARTTTTTRTTTSPHRFVKVQEGDTASSIADAAGISVDRLAELNPSIDPNTLRLGQTLKLAP